MPELEYNLSTGIDPNNLLNLRLDTQERMRDLTDGFNVPNYVPPQSFIPKHFEGDDILQGNAKLPTLDDALSSKNPDIARAAQQELYKRVDKDPKSKGWGVGRYLEYQPGQNAFTQDHWWKEKQYTMYGFDPYKSIAENEDWLHKQTWDNYSLPGQIWRGVGTFAGRTLSKLVTGLVGTVGDVGAIAWNELQELGDAAGITDGKNNFWADVSNNWLSRKMTEVDDYTKQEILPVYKALDYDQKGAWNKLMDPYTWQTSFADGAGFLLQFAIPGSMFGKAAMAGKMSRAIGEFSTIAELEALGPEGKLLAEQLAKSGKTIEQAKNVSGFSKFMGLEIPETTKFGKFAGKLSEGLTGSKDLGGISAHLFNTSMEAVSETKSGFDDTVQNLREKGMSEQEAIKIASENAPTQFWLNMGILSASNAFENKLLQKAIGNRGLEFGRKLDVGGEPIEPNPTTWFGKALEKTFGEGNKWGNRVKFYGKLGLESAWWEGYWEENAQTAAQRYAAGRYTRYGDDTGKEGKEEKSIGFWSQYIRQTIDAAKGNDREAADSIMAGVVIGVLGGTTFAKMSNERKEEIADKAKVIADYKNARDAWLSLSASTEDLYDKNGKLDTDKAKKKAEDINEKLKKMSSVFIKAITADQLVDPQEREELQHQVFADYVKAHILNGTADQLVNRLANWGEKSPGELALYGVTPELQKDSAKWSALVQKLVDVWDNIQDIKYSASKDEIAVAPKGDKTTQTYFAKSQAIKSLIYDYTALKGMSDTLAQTYQDFKNQANPFVRFPMQQAFNEKQAEILAYKDMLEKEPVAAIRDQISKKLDELEKDQEERKKNLLQLGESKQDGSTFMFPKGVDPKSNPIDMNDVNDFLEFQFHQSIHENNSKTYEGLIKDYSDPKKGLLKWNKTVEFWSAKKKADEKTAAEQADNEEFKDTIDTLSAQKTKLEADLATAKTEEERKDIQAQLDEVNGKIEKTKQDAGKTEDDLKDESLDDINKDLSTPPIETQFGVEPNKYDSERLAWVTSFKTVNSETRDSERETGERIPWKEDVLEHSYDHDLSEFVKDFDDFPGKYETFVIADTEDFLRQRYSQKQYDAYIANRGELGAIIVFKEKGKEGWVKFAERKGNPIVAFSYNEAAFEDRKRQRAEIKANKTGISIDEALKIYEEQQKLADLIRQQVKMDPSLIVPVTSTLGSLGVYPTTTSKGSALERFGEFVDKDSMFEPVKDVNNYPSEIGLNLGDVVLKIPKTMTDSKLPFYIPVTGGTLRTGKTDTNLRVYNAVEGVYRNKFDTKEEAQVIVQNFLKLLFYVNTQQYFKVVKDGDKFRINYFKKDKDGKEIGAATLNNLKLKLLDPLYRGVSKFIIYEKDKVTNKFTPIELSNEDYKTFIHNSLETSRKLLTVKRTGVEKVWTHKVNAYLNIDSKDAELTNKGNETTSTKEVIAPLNIAPKKESNIGKIRQEEGIKALRNIMPYYNQFEDNSNSENVYNALVHAYKLFGIEGLPQKDNYVVKNLATSLNKDIVEQNFVYHILFGLTRNTSDLNKVIALFSENRDMLDNKNKQYLSVMINYYNNNLIEEKKRVDDYFNSKQSEIDKQKGALYYEAMKESSDRLKNTAPLPILDIKDSNEAFKKYNDKYSEKLQKSAMTETGKEDIKLLLETVDKIVNIKNPEVKKEEAPKKVGKIHEVDVESVKTTEHVLEAISQLKENIEIMKSAIQAKIDATEDEATKAMFKEKGAELIGIQEQKIADLEKLLPDSEEKPQTPLQELKTEAALSQPMPDVSPITTIKAGRMEIQFDFDKKTVLSAAQITPERAEKIKEVLEKASAYTLKEIKINQNNVYLVKYNKLGKFVITNELFQPIPETPEIQNNEEYKKFKNCE